MSKHIITYSILSVIALVCFFWNIDIEFDGYSVLLLEQEGKRVQIECDHLPHEYEKMLVEILLLENINVLPEVVLLVFK